MIWLLAQPPAGGDAAEVGQSSPIALIVILLLAVAVVLLIRSMNKHLRKVPTSFHQEPGRQRIEGSDTDTPGDR